MNLQWKSPRAGLTMLALSLIMASSSVHADGQADSHPTIEGNRSHQISLNRSGAIEGRISAGEDNSELNVYFVRDGKIVRQTRTSDGGYFVAENMATGPYSFIATGQNGFVAYGVQVQPFNNGTAVNAMEAAAISTRFEGLSRIIENNMPAKIASEIMAIDSAASTGDGFTGENIVQLRNGQLVGRVATVQVSDQDIKGTQVFLIRDGSEISRTTVDQNGQFTVTGIDSGVYDFVAAGANGIAAIRFQAISDVELSNLRQRSENPIMFPVSFASTPAPIAAAALEVCLTCQQDNNFVGEQIDYAVGGEYMEATPYDSMAPIEYASEAAGCGCAAGGSCGGSGTFGGFASGGGFAGAGGGFGGGGFGGAGLGGFGGGGLNRLIGLGGLVGGIVGLANSGDSANSNPGDNSPNQVSN